MNYVIVYSGTVRLFWDLSKKSASQLLFSAVVASQKEDGRYLEC